VVERRGARGSRAASGRRHATRSHPAACLLGRSRTAPSTPAPSPGFALAPPPPGCRATVTLPGRGPALLLSARSTADTPRLRWRFCVAGSTALELGALEVQDADAALASARGDALHRGSGSGCGFASRVTAGSHLPGSFALTRGAAVELTLADNTLKLTVTHAPGAGEPAWAPAGAGGVPRAALVPYKGPRTVSMALDLPPGRRWRLAATAWSGAALEVLTADGGRGGGAALGARGALPLLPLGATTAAPPAAAPAHRGAKRARCEAAPVAATSPRAARARAA